MGISNLLKCKKIVVLGIILFVTVILLTGCGSENSKVTVYDKTSGQDMEILPDDSENDANNNGEDENTNTEEKEESNDNGEVDKNNNNGADTTTNANSNQKENNKTVSGVSSGYVNGSKEYTHALVVTGYDSNGETVWSYKTDETPLTELETAELLHIGKNRVYINCSGTIQVLNKQTGKLIWENKDYGGANTSYDFDDNDTLYLSGYYGPLLCIIDFNGNTLNKINSEDYYWTSSIDVNSEKGIAKIYCDGYKSNDDEPNETICVKVNLKDYSIEGTEKAE